MTASEFDPLAAMQALEAAGVERKHAEVHAAQLLAVANADLGRLATKFDLDSLRKEFESLRREFESLRREFESLRREVRYGLGIVTAINLAMVGRLFGIL